MCLRLSFVADYKVDGQVPIPETGIQDWEQREMGVVAQSSQ